ncbi:MAG TPA: ATP-binding protein [Bryobacteraceae bacterium]
MKRRLSLGKVWVLALGLAACAAAQQYSFRFYGAAEGLQNLVVLSLAQDRAGYIWAATEAGLYRYDGVHFRLMGQAEGLPCSTEAHSLFVAFDGALWANTCAKIFRFDGQRFEPVSGIDRLVRGSQVMADGPNGSLLVATPVGVFQVPRRAGSSLSAQPHPLPEGLAGKPMHGILRQGALLWFGCNQNICLEQDGRVSIFGEKEGLPEDSWDGLQITPDGSVWARSPTRIYRKAPGQARFSQEKPDIAPSGFWGAIAPGQDGSLLVPTDQGLAIYTTAGWSVINRQRGLRNEKAASALEDREGSIWIGLTGGGIARWLGRGVWEFWKTSDGLPSDLIWSIRRDRRGALWVGTSLGLARLDAGPTRIWTRDNGLPGDDVRWLAETSDGSIWAAVKPGGLTRINPVTGTTRSLGLGDGLPCDPEDVFVDRQDRVWAPTRCGLFLNDRPSASTRFIQVKTPESFGSVAWKVMEDKEGTIWVVTAKNGLWSLREGQWRQFRRSEGLLTDNPYVMALAPDGSIWIRHRYDAGVDRIEVANGRVLRVTSVVSPNAAEAEVTAFHGFDAFGNFWRGSTKGVMVRRGNAWTTFTTEDGLVSNDCDGEAFWAAADGSVWLGTGSGLAHYIFRGASSTSALIATPIIARLDIDETARLLRAEFSTLNYKAEQLVRFGYRLDNGPWVDSVERYVSIWGLGPGGHRLEVRSRIRDGPPASQIASTEFRLKPRWPETWWARGLAFAGFAGAIVLFIRWRLSAASQRRMELEAMVAARTEKLSEANRALDHQARQLHSSEDRLKNAERLAHLGHWDWDIKSNRITWSEEMFRIFGQPREYTPSYEASLQAVASQDRVRVERWVRDCLAEKNGHSIEFQIARPDSELRAVSYTCEVALDDQGAPLRMFGACLDVTEMRRAQRETFERQKLESVGTLASGIAHDFNNLLGGVLAQAELAMGELAGGTPPEGELSAIREAALRGSEIVRELMIYAGKESAIIEPVDVSRVVREMLELLKISVSKHASVETDLGLDLPAVPANPAQLRQIVMNLVMNASDAIGGQDGFIRVTTKCVKVDSDSSGLAAEGLARGDYIELRVSDTGRGMLPEVQAKVFDPFFTTKSAGHGLGLAVVQGIVRALGGSIQVSSRIGKGTTFEILLPAEATTERVPNGKPGDSKAKNPFQGATALVVEDESPLRIAVAAMLRKTGFEVIEAGDGFAAIDLLRASGSKIDVILLDLTIPGPGSSEVVAEAAKIKPDVRVILTSAYSEEATAGEMNAPQIRSFIRKPFKFAELVQTLGKAFSS